MTVSMSSQLDAIRTLCTEDDTHEAASANVVSVSGKPLTIETVPRQEEDAEVTLTRAMERVVADIRRQTNRELTDEEMTAISTFGIKSKRALWSTTKLMVYTNETRMTKSLEETTPGRRRGEPGKAYTGILLDVKHLGSPATAPNQRIMTLNPAVVKTMLRSFMKTRGPPELHPGDIYFILDGGMHSYRQKVLNCFIDDEGTILSKSEKLMYLLFDEESIRQRKGCAMGDARIWPGRAHEHRQPGHPRCDALQESQILHGQQPGQHSR